MERTKSRANQDYYFSMAFSEIDGIIFMVTPGIHREKGVFLLPIGSAIKVILFLL